MEGCALTFGIQPVALIMIDRHLSASCRQIALVIMTTSPEWSDWRRFIAPQRDHQLIIDVICKWHDAAVMRITRRVLLARRWWQQLPLWPTPTHSGRGLPATRCCVLTQSDVQTKRVAQSLHLHLEETPKEFFLFLFFFFLPAEHCSALSIRADRAADLLLGNLFVPLTKYC